MRNAIFISFNLTFILLKQDNLSIIGIDNMNKYYDVNLKEYRLKELIRAKVLPSDYDFESHKKLVAMQPGDVPITYADTSELEKDFGYKPSTSLRIGLRRFAEWYYKFYIKEGK